MTVAERAAELRELQVVVNHPVVVKIVQEHNEAWRKLADLRKRLLNEEETLP